MGEEASRDRGIQDDKTEKNVRAGSVKESEIWCQSLHAVAGESLISLLISQHAS